MYGDVMNNTKCVLSSLSGVCISDIADRNYPFKEYRMNFKQIPKITNDFLSTNDFD